MLFLEILLQRYAMGLMIIATGKLMMAYRLIGIVWIMMAMNTEMRP
jgi:hypothetical protein